MSNENTIQVEIKRVYGVDTIYPYCDKAKLFARLARTKTLTVPVVKLIKELGYTVHVVNNIASQL